MNSYEIANEVVDRQLLDCPLSIENRYSAACGGLRVVIGSMLCTLKYQFPEAFEKVIKDLPR
jgi:hypothetical protein